MNVKTHRNSTLEVLEHTQQLREFTSELLQNLNYSPYRPLFATQDEWTVVKYVREVVRRFWYWTLWMSKRYTVILHQIITVYNDMFDHMDGVMPALAEQNTQWKEDLFFTVELARQKVSKYHAEVPPTTGTLHFSAHCLDTLCKLQSGRKLDRMDSYPEDNTSYTTQYKEAFLKYMENEWCAKYRHVPVNEPENVRSSNPVPYTLASGSRQLSFDPYDLSSNDDEYLTPTKVAETTPGLSDRAARS